MTKLQRLLLITFTLTNFASHRPEAIAQSEFNLDPESSKAIPNFIGKTILIRGNAYRLDKKSMEKDQLKKSSSILRKDVITTKARTFVKIKMIDDSILSIGPNSTVEMIKYEFRSKKDRKSIYNIIKGQFRANFKHKAKEVGDIKVRANNISLGVRGTKILANNYKDKKNTSITQFVLLSGKAFVTDNNLGRNENLSPGMHYISVIKENDLKGKASLERLDQKTLKAYLSSEEEKRFQPMLNFHKLNYKESSLKGNSHSHDSKGSHNSEMGGKNNKSWKENLKELNRRLQQYNSN